MDLLIKFFFQLIATYFSLLPTRKPVCFVNEADGLSLSLILWGKRLRFVGHSPTLTRTIPVLRYGLHDGGDNSMIAKS